MQTDCYHTCFACKRSPVQSSYCPWIISGSISGRRLWTTESEQPLRIRAAEMVKRETSDLCQCKATSFSATFDRRHHYLALFPILAMLTSLRQRPLMQKHYAMFSNLLYPLLAIKTHLTFLNSFLRYAIFPVTTQLASYLTIKVIQE